MRVRGEAAPQMQGHRQRVAPQSAEPSSLGLVDVEYGHVETILQRRQRCPLDPVEEPAVGGAAAQIDVLSVVYGQFAALEGEGEPAEAGPAFEQGDTDTRVGESERGGDAGEPAADHDGVPPGLMAVGHRAPSPARPPW